SAPTSAPTTNTASTSLPSRDSLGGVVRYAVGASGVVLQQRGVGPWVRLPSPGAVNLRAAWVASTGVLYVVGDGGAWFVREASSSSVATWRRLKTPKGEILRAISGSSAKDVYAVGDHGVAFHFDGKTVRAERTTTDQTLYGIRILDFDKIWAAGDRCTVRRRIPGRLWYHGPVETKPFKPTLLPPIFKHKPTCHSDLRAIWRPHNDLRKAKTLVTRLATRYRRSKLVGRIQIHRPVKFFEDRALYFLDVEDLGKLTTEISDRLDKEAGKRSGIVVDLEDDEDDAKPGATGQSATSSGAALKDEQSPRIKKLYEKFRHLATQRGRSPWYLHPDGASVGLLVVSRPHAGLTDLRRLRELLRREALDALPKAGDAMLQIDVGGDGENKILEYDATLADITGLVWLAVIGIVLLLVIYFRRLVGLLFVIVPLAMSIAWTFALTTWAIGTLNIITAFLFAVLFGLGIDFGLQFYGRYREERLLGASV
ncbi:MAG: MMPL family transporter, partial [Deltaproteobacteria bacterium]|nr:MMPL family transporter [Deltaproteobacteria bacterium]